MNFSSEWEDSFQANTHMSLWPWSDLISFVMRYSKPRAKSLRVLELGCGAGANIPFFLSQDMEYYAIEGSRTIVENVVRRYPMLEDNIIVGDFTTEFPLSLGQFDLIVDRAALTHNTTSAIQNTITHIYNRLNPMGKFIGIDWFSTQYSDYRQGKQAEDVYTRTGYTEGSFAKLGRVHFSDKKHLLELFEKFDMLVMEHKTVKREVPDNDWNFASWNFVAQKI
ncbi:MAG: class I SAM-dependent methyltransferase [Candidatus Electrothrix sp. LOE1_4_5]|nr:class I SAM-dependent methyltransferase [Candidatus Electrothrix gigas]